MFRPRDFVGIEYFVTIATDCGEIWRRIVAFDREDAADQARSYCEAEGLIAAAVIVQ